jgi:DNA-binding transcriptional LysR family regulator
MYDWAELRHFRYLLAILERQGFRIAAEELHTSQPNLSVQARQFQENASVRLYKKLENGRIRPTETGLAFIALAKLLLETRDEVINALIAIERGEIGSVRFGCPVDWLVSEPSHPAPLTEP